MPVRSSVEQDRASSSIYMQIEAVEPVEENQP